MFHNVEQNTVEWMDMRVGKLTSSNMGKIMANYGKAFGDPAKKYATQIAVERITGNKCGESFSNSHTDRGHEQEPLARMAYEESLFCEVTNGGFFDLDRCGCSPDGMVDLDGVIEIKSVLPHVHLANVSRKDVDPAYKWQCYTNLKWTEREYLDFISYCDDFPEEKKIYVYRIFADQLKGEFIFDMIDQRVNKFLELVDSIELKIMNSEYMLIAA